MGQNQWYKFGVDAPPILVLFSGHWDVHWGYDLDFDPQPYYTVLSVPSLVAPCLGLIFSSFSPKGKPERHPLFEAVKAKTKETMLCAKPKGKTTSFAGLAQIKPT